MYNYWQEFTLATCILYLSSYVTLLMQIETRSLNEYFEKTTETAAEVRISLSFVFVFVIFNVIHMSDTFQ